MVNNLLHNAWAVIKLRKSQAVYFTYKAMTITATVNDDETITFEWDENDPIDSILNTWTEQDFLNAILNYCKETIGEEECDKIMKEHQEESCNQNENESKTQS
jgi:hypothetical protein